MADELIDNIKQIVELQVNLRHLTNDVNALFEKQRSLETTINSLEEKITTLNAELNRYKFIVLGVAGALSFVYALAQTIASVFNISLLDLFNKHG